MPYRIAIDDGRAVQTLDVGAARLSIGTSPACRLRLSSAGVAYRHAVMRQKGDRVVVEDISQAPNITVDGRSVARAEVGPGQVIGIGAAKLRVLEVTVEAAAPAAPASEQSKSAETPTSPSPAASPLPKEPAAAPTTPAAPTSAPPVSAAEAPKPSAPPSPAPPSSPAPSAAPSSPPAPAPPPPAPPLATKPAVAPRKTWSPPEAPAPVRARNVVHIAPATAVLGPSRRDRTRRRFVAPASASIVFHAVLLIVLQFAVPVGGGTRTEDARFSLRPTERTEFAEVADMPVLPDPVAWDEAQAEKPLAEPTPLVDLADLSIPQVPATAPAEPPPAEPVPEPVTDRIVRAPSPEPPLEAPRGVVGVGADGGGTPQIPSRSFGKGEAGKANGLAAELLGDDRGGGGALRKVRGLASDDRIWVVHGDYDQAERVLQGLEIAHRVIAQSALESSEIPSSVRVVVFNCSGKPLSERAARRVAAWVEAGGALLSSDWGLDRVVTRAFPGRLKILRSGVKTSLTKDETIEAKTCGTHALLEGVPSDRPFRWWLEDSSVPFHAAEDVEVLVRSRELGRRNGADAVAATFTHGRGTVLHVLGHVFQQEGTLSGAYAMQRIVVNFLGRALGE